MELEQLDAKLPVRDIFARKILDCRGNPTVEAEVLAGENIVGRASAPAGLISADNAGSGIQECCHDKLAEMADRMVENINTHIAQELVGKNVFDQEEIDRTMSRLDGTENISVMGAGSVFSVSAAAANAAAAALGLPLYRYLGGVQAKQIPVPAVPVICGGPSDSSSSTGIQEILVVPSDHDTLWKQLGNCADIFRMLGKISAVRDIPMTGTGGGYISALSDIKEILRLIRAAAEQAGYRWGKDITVALNVSAEKLYDAQRKCYYFSREGEGTRRECCRSTQEMIDYYEELASEFPISSIEDPMAPEDWDGWAGLTERLGERMQIVGNRIFRGGIKKLEQGIRMGAANAVYVRAGQQGTLTGLSDELKAAREAGYGVIVGHDCGETADTVASDLAVAFGAAQIRFGSPLCLENAEKYNRLFRIAERIEKNDDR